jgi:hypothetical protein
MPFQHSSQLNPETQSNTNSQYTTNQTHNPIPMHHPIQPNSPTAAHSQPNPNPHQSQCIDQSNPMPPLLLAHDPITQQQSHGVRPIPACTSTAQSSIPMLSNPNPTLPNPTQLQPSAAEFIPTQ